MPDVHWGIGATVGSVIPTVGAVIPAAVGVDIGCGMMAVQTTLTANDLPESLREVRRGDRAGGAARHQLPGAATRARGVRRPRPRRRHGRGSSRASTAIVAKHPTIRQSNNLKQLGTLGTGNHFIEVCLDEADRVWLMLHSGSRGVGNRSARYFIELAKKDMRQWLVNLPDKDLAYFRRAPSTSRVRGGGGVGAGLRDDEPPADDGGGDARDALRARHSAFEAVEWR
jgi:tRNA-splicing ligase RtcB